MARKVAQRSAERLPKHILKIISVIGTHPEWEDRHARGLSEHIGVGSSRSNGEDDLVFKVYTVQFNFRGHLINRGDQLTWHGQSGGTGQLGLAPGRCSPSPCPQPFS